MQGYLVKLVAIWAPSLGDETTSSFLSGYKSQIKLNKNNSYKRRSKLQKSSISPGSIFVYTMSKKSERYKVKRGSMSVKLSPWPKIGEQMIKATPLSDPSHNLLPIHFTGATLMSILYCTCTSPVDQGMISNNLV